MRRKRVLIVGNRLGHRFDLPPIQNHASGAIYRKAAITLHDAISGLPQAAKAHDSAKPVRYEVPAASEWERKIRSAQGVVFDHFMPNLTAMRRDRMKAHQAKHERLARTFATCLI